MTHFKVAAVTFFGIMLMVSAQAMAQPGRSCGQPSIDLNNVDFAGSCPSMDFRETNGRVSILLNEMWGLRVASGWQSQTCNIFIPIDVPPGTTCYISEVSFEGNTRIADDGYTYATLRHRFAGTVGTADAEWMEDTGTFEVTKSFDRPYVGGACGFQDELWTTVTIGAENYGSGSSRIELTSGSLNPAIEYELVCIPC